MDAFNVTRVVVGGALLTLGLYCVLFRDRVAARVRRRQGDGAPLGSAVFWGVLGAVQTVAGALQVLFAVESA